MSQWISWSRLKGLNFLFELIIPFVFYFFGGGGILFECAVKLYMTQTHNIIFVVEAGLHLGEG